MNEIKINSDCNGFVGNRSTKGFIRICSVNPKTGETRTLVHKLNTILYQGADIMANALAGVDHAKISHFYIGFNTGTFTPDPITKDNSTMRIDGNYGYLRIPLTYPASYLTETNYANNIVVFSVLVSNPEAYRQGTNAFLDGASMFEVALVSAYTGAVTGDKIFSRAQFEPIAYDSAHNITVSWGIKFISE